jgi:hypothetical protein
LLNISFLLTNQLVLQKKFFCTFLPLHHIMFPKDVCVCGGGGVGGGGGGGASRALMFVHFAFEGKD